MSNYKKILVGIDLTKLSEDLIRRALMIGEAFESEIVVSHIIDYVPPNYMKAELPEIYVSEDIMKERAEKNIRALIEKYTDKEIELNIRVGKRKAGLLQVADQIQADLIIMGKHDSNTVDKILGSTTTDVVNQTNCAMLIVHA